MEFYEPCTPEDNNPARVNRPFNEWPLEQMRPRAITWVEIKEALAAVNPTVTREELKMYEEWTLRYGVSSV